MNEQSYRSWVQGAAELNEREAWPAELFPEAEWHYFKEAGCLITSLSIMLRRFGIEQEPDEARFNPWVLNERLIGAGAFTPSADLILEDIHKLYPLEYAGELPYSRETLVRHMELGDPFLITVPGVHGPRHFVVPDELTENDLRIIDPGWSKRFLSEFDVIHELCVFRGTDGTGDGEGGNLCRKESGQGLRRSLRNTARPASPCWRTASGPTSPCSRPPGSAG